MNRTQFTPEQLDKVLSILDEQHRLSKLTPRQLIDEALNTPHADNLLVTELMNRVLPQWEQEEPT
jgi:hypothetical protein